MTQTLTLTLEWFLNPDHLPMIAGIETGAYAEQGIELRMIEPDDHYDGFTALQQGEIDLHVNEPIHLFEHYHPDICALGCFFETDGGVLMRADRMQKLRNGEKIRICTPAAEPETNRIGYEILKRYVAKHGGDLQQSQLEFISAGFHHVDNLLGDDSLDGAWLCFYNFEAIEAQQKGLDFVFIDQKESPYPNFSALEFITSRQTLAKKQALIQTFLDITRRMTQHCQANPELAKQYYYAYSKTQEDDLMNAIILDTLPRLDAKIQADAQRWSALREMLAEIDLIHLQDEQYQSIWQDL
ncbi:MAG: ABC transporter substrate-binding protein, partial [Acinetobacter sp.]|nr:ABC transporter substrate-binding protein [Acinetobacter sp.]